MKAVVPAASTSLAWCFPDETSERADEILVALKDVDVLVPAVWSLEVANAILAGERKKHVTIHDVLRFLALLQQLSLRQDVLPAGDSVAAVLPIAREYGLSAYDGADLELAIRHGAALATLDERTERAAFRRDTAPRPGRLGQGRRAHPGWR